MRMRIRCGLIVAMIVALGLSVPLTGAAAVDVGQPCGGSMRLSCGARMWCDWPAGKCNGSDVQGKCADIPAACPKSTRSVCGCDQRTYVNDCERIRAGVQKDRDGACK